MASLSLPDENHYGHTKKLRFLLGEIEKHKSVLRRPVTVLDFGCGNGSAVSQYLMGDGVRYYGVDIHPDSLSYAKENFSQAGATFTDKIPTDVSFDIIVYADVLEHVPDPEALLREHASLLAPDGIVLAAVPNGYGPFELESRVDEWLSISRLMGRASRIKRSLLQQPIPESQVALPYNHQSGHLVFFTRKSLQRVIANAGFQIARFAHGAVMGASVSGVLLGRSPLLKRWNTSMADKLPSWAVSTWYVTLKRSS